MDDDGAIAADEAERIFTVGYGGRTFEELLALLRRHSIGCLVDVRSAPYSRFRPEFSRPALEPALTTAGIRYVFLGDTLGGRPDADDCYVDGKVDYDLVRDKEFYRQGIERLQRAFHQRMRLVLMCSEGRPEECHRSKLIGVTLEALGIPTTHLDEEGGAISQAAVIERLTGGQLNLFGDPSLSSRRRYRETP